MVVDDVEFLNILKGKRIKLTLKTASYLGVLQHINPNKTLILADGQIHVLPLCVLFNKSFHINNLKVSSTSMGISNGLIQFILLDAS